MRATRQRDTRPEIALRSALHRRGLRFRLHRAIPGVARVRPDILFVAPRVAVYVDGCFWHGCEQHGSLPKANRSWWEAKLQANVDRDRRHRAAIESAGWAVVRVWEHEEPESAAELIQELIRGFREAEVEDRVFGEYASMTGRSSL